VRPLKWLRHLGVAIAVIVVVAVVFAYAIVANRSEQVFLVNDGRQALRVDGCDVDGFQIPPGRYKTPLGVTDRLICPVYRNGDSAYLGCLIIKREALHNRQILIWDSMDPGVTLSKCDPG